VKIRTRAARLLIFWLVCVLPALACNLPPAYTAQDYLPPTVTGYPARLETLAAAPPVITAPPSAPAVPTPTLPAPPPAPPATPVVNTIPTDVPAVYKEPTLPPISLVDVSQHLVYTVQSGDTLPAVAARFNVAPETILSDQPVDPVRLLPPGHLLYITPTLEDASRWGFLLPDSEVVYARAAGQFDAAEYIRQAGGFLVGYGELINGEWHTSAQIVNRVASETSVNPRLLLAFIEYRARWVTSQPLDPEQMKNPLGFYAAGYEGLYKELSLAGNHLNIGYYGWRMGNRTVLEFKDRSRMRMDPELNAGSAALQNLFSKFYDRPGWSSALYGSENITSLYTRMFGDPWERALETGALLSPDVEQPQLELPFQPGQAWAMTAGPHISWTNGTPRGALDFAPMTGDANCRVSRAWAVASAPGLVVRSENSAVAIDLDGDGNEGTGWVLFYFHMAEDGRVQAGTWLDQDGLIGHPSCEGGRSTGTHLHLARKYNGEWIAADGPLPMILSGWVAQAGEHPYDGSLTRGDQVVVSNINAPRTSVLSR
jgi:LasA protease